MSERVENIQTAMDLESLSKIKWGSSVLDLEAISKSNKLPILVRAMESHYGNSDLSTFSKLDVLKLHKGVDVDLVLATFERSDKTKDASRSGQKDDHGLTVDMMDDKPVQICFPKDFCGVFQLACAGEKARKYQSALKLAKHMPKFVRVIKRKQDFPEDIQENDVIQILGEITEGDTTYLSVKRNKIGAEPTKISMKCKGVFETVTDTKCYNLSEILQLFSLPLVVNLPKKSKHAVNVKSEVLSLLNHVGGTLTLQREVASEFFVASTTVQDTPEQTTILVLSKNANVQFQVAEDQEDRDYKKVLETFGTIALKGIPQELFISEHGMPFVACLNYKKHTAQIKNPQISSHDIPPTPPPRPISTRQQLPLPGYADKKLAPAKSQEKQDTSSEGSGESPLYDQINTNALGQRERVRVRSPQRQATDNDYYAGVRQKPLIFQGGDQSNTSPVSVRRNKSFASETSSIDRDTRRTSKVGRSSSDTQARYPMLPMIVPRKEEIVRLRDNLEKVNRGDAHDLPTSITLSRHEQPQIRGERLTSPHHTEGDFCPLRRVRDEIPFSSNYRSRFHREPDHDNDQNRMMDDTSTRIVERKHIPTPVSSCASTNIHTASTSYPDRNRRNPIPGVQISLCQEDNYMNMNKRNTRDVNSDFLYPPPPQSAATPSYFPKSKTGSLPRSSRMVSQMIPDGSQSSDYFVPTPRQLQRHRVEFSDSVSADGYIVMAQSAHVNFEEQSRFGVSSANYINSPRQPLSTIMTHQVESRRERSRSLESILSEPSNQSDPPTLPPRPSNLSNSPPPQSQLINNNSRHVSHHFDQSSSRGHNNTPCNNKDHPRQLSADFTSLHGRSNASPPSESVVHSNQRRYYLQQPPHTRSDTWHQQSHDLDRNTDRDYQRRLPISFRASSIQPEYSSNRLQTRSGYSTVPRQHHRSSTAPELTLPTKDIKKRPPPVPERSENNFRRSSDLTSLRSTGYYIEEEINGDATPLKTTSNTPGLIRSSNTRALPPLETAHIPPQPESTSEGYNQDDDDLYDDLAAPPYENDNFNVSSAVSNQGSKDCSLPPTPSADNDSFPPLVWAENYDFPPPSANQTDDFLSLPPSAEYDYDGFPPPPSDNELQYILSTSPKLDTGARFTSKQQEPTNTLSTSPKLDAAGQSTTNQQKPKDSLSTSKQNTAARFTSKRQIPKDINQLSVSELSQCLRLLKVDNNVIDVLQEQQVDGTLLKHMSEDMIISLGVSEFQAKKLNLFARYGWRPTSSCDIEMLEYFY